MENFNKIMSVINAINNIEVKGKNNLMNLGGCIAVLKVRAVMEGIDLE